MTYFPPEFKERVVEAVPVEELLKEYTQENIHHGNFSCIFPSHVDDNNPSMHYFEDTDSAYCYTCQQQITDSINLLQKVEGMDFKEALVHLANKAHIPLPDDSDKELSKEQKLRNEMYNKAVEFYKNLVGSEEDYIKRAKKYLNDRGISDETIKKFGIGYCRNTHENRDDKKYRKFINRIVFPIFDEHKRITGFGGRILPWNKDQDSVKYINSSKKRIKFFDKGDLLYNLHNAKHNVNKKGFLYIFEGYTDVALAYEHGIYNAVGTMGIALTDSHLEKIKKITNKVLIYMDPDEAGMNGVTRVLDKFEKAGIRLEIIYDKEGNDPAEKIKKLGSDFDSWAQKVSKTPEQFYTDLYLSEYRQEISNAKYKLIQNIAKAFSGRLDRLESQFFLQSVCNEIDISYKALEKRIKKLQ